MKFDLRPLSNPFVGNFVELCNVVSNQFALKSALECGITPQNSSLFNGARPELGATRLCKMLGKLNDTTLTWHYFQTAIASFLAGLVDTLELEAEVTLPITIAGITLSESKYYVVGAGEKLTVRIESGEVFEFTRIERNKHQFLWQCENSSRKEIKLGSYKTISIVDPTWISDWNYRETIYPNSKKISSDFIHKVEDAYNFLQQNCPEYYLWSIALVEEISCISPEVSKSLASQSFSFWPGQIHVSYSNNLYLNLDCIIHENSHLYFNLIEWIEPVCKQNAPSVYSPLKRVKRPFKTILLAYHAIGNLLLLLLHLKHQGVKRQFDNLLDAISFNSKIVWDLESILVEHRSFLSESGEQLFRPLQEKLLQAGFGK